MSGSRIVRAGAVAEILSAATIIVVTILAVFTYRNELKAETRRYSFELSTRYFEGEVLESRARLQRVAADSSRALESEMRTQENIGQLIRADYLNDEIRGGASNFEDDLFNVIDFFDMIASCTEQSLCDPDVLLALTREEAGQILCVFGPSIEELGARYSMAALDNSLVEISGEHSCG